MDGLFETCYNAYQKRRTTIKKKKTTTPIFKPTKQFWSWLDDALLASASCGECWLHFIQNMAFVENENKQVIAQFFISGTSKFDMKLFYEHLEARYGREGFDVSVHGELESYDKFGQKFDGHFVFNFDWTSK
jgi:hypothetical protein